MIYKRNSCRVSQMRVKNNFTQMTKPGSYDVSSHCQVAVPRKGPMNCILLQITH